MFVFGVSDPSVIVVLECCILRKERGEEDEKSSKTGKERKRKLLRE